MAIDRISNQTSSGGHHGTCNMIHPGRVLYTVDHNRFFYDKFKKQRQGIVFD